MYGFGEVTLRPVTGFTISSTFFDLGVRFLYDVASCFGVELRLELPILALGGETVRAVVEVGDTWGENGDEV